ncbi:Uncharacterized protein APZ42_012574 [Daphnia magna]|uniref:MADF domain-containing protein n=1 Tax=Daphnia magna TaxID=35525 RepID=A0A162RMQ2_9CRUS|nr:Uncharacterized protein APZ42_012574 [Daphnia magna]
MGSSTDRRVPTADSRRKRGVGLERRSPCEGLRPTAFSTRQEAATGRQERGGFSVGGSPSRQSLVDPKLDWDTFLEEEEDMAERPMFHYKESEKFRGTLKENAIEWIDRFERISRHNRWSNNDLEMAINVSLEGAAYKWIVGLEARNARPEHWEDLTDQVAETDDEQAHYKEVRGLKTLFLKQFVGVNLKRHMERKLRMRVLGKEEDITEYYHDVMDMFRIVQPDMAEEVRIDHLFRRMSPALYERLYVLGIKPCEEFLEEARLHADAVKTAYERGHEDARREREKPAVRAVGLDKVQDLEHQIQELRDELGRAGDPSKTKEKKGRKANETRSRKRKIRFAVLIARKKDTLREAARKKRRRGRRSLRNQRGGEPKAACTLIGGDQTTGMTNVFCLNFKFKMSVNKITNSKKTVSPKKSERLPTRVSPRKKIVKTVYDLDIASGSGVKSSAKKRISTYPWNEERIQEMIQGVSEYPVLYDISRDDYKDVTVHARALDAVAQRLTCCTGADVKSKWEYLRKCWLNERREQNKEDPSGTGTDDLKKNQRKPFAYYESMGFISPFTKSRVGRHTNITNNKYFQTDDYGNENDADEAVQQQQTVEVVHVELSLDSSNSVFASEQTKQILQNGTFYSSDSDQFADELMQD